MKHIKRFNNSELNESWRNALLGFILLFSSCDGISVKDKSGNKVSTPDEYTTTGVIKDLTKVPLDDGQTQYIMEIIDDSTGNLIKIRKYALNPFPKDETSGYWWLSSLKSGSHVKVVCNDDDCKVYLEK